MNKSLTLYVNDRPLELVELAADKKESPADTLFPELIDPGAKEIREFIQRLETGQEKGLKIYATDWEKTKSFLFSLYELWKAAGGLVVNQQQEVLLIFRRGKWDLPKGKLDNGESIEACAIREVSEETGLRSLQLQHQIGETFHTYSQNGRPILKQTFWYHMLFTGTELTVPQIEEDILDIQWIQPTHLSRYLKYSYQNIAAVFRAAGYAL